MWTTKLDWDGTNWVVTLLARDGAAVAVMSLDDWAKLSATSTLTDEARQEAAQLQREAAATEEVRGHG